MGSLNAGLWLVRGFYTTIRKKSQELVVVGTCGNVLRLIEQTCIGLIPELLPENQGTV